LRSVRWALLVLLVAAPALARPKVAVAPLDGDEDQKISAIVADAAGDHAKVTGPGRVAKALDTLSITSLSGKSLKKLRSNLEVDVVIHGAVKKKHVSLTLSGRGKQKATLELDYKSTKALRKELASQLGKKLDAAAGGNDDDGDDDDDKKSPFADSPKDKKADDSPKKHVADDDDKPKKHDDDDKPKKRVADDDRPKKHDDDDKPRKRVADEDDSVRKRSDDDDTRGKRRRHRRDDDEPDHPRNEITQAALYLDAGAAFARRTLTYDYAPGGTAGMGPPGVGTAAGAGAIEGEVYPGAFGPGKTGSGFGLFGAFAYAVGLGIAVPGANVSAPIKDGHYSIGARYRVAFGGSSIAFGAAYWRRWYIADRSTLMTGQTLDMPDVDYTAVAPGVEARFPASPKIGVLVALDIPLMFDAGPVTKSDSYGGADALAFDLVAGVQIILGPHYALQLRGDFDQVGLSFKAKPQSGAAVRGVNGATDRTIGLTATLGLLY